MHITTPVVEEMKKQWEEDRYCGCDRKCPKCGKEKRPQGASPWAVPATPWNMPKITWDTPTHCGDSF